MDGEKNEPPITFENVTEVVKTDVTNDVINVPVVVEKVKKPRSEKQQMALKAMIEKRKEKAVIERADRKERRAPKWYREINKTDKKVEEMEAIIEMLKEQIFNEAHKESFQEKEPQVEENEVIKDEPKKIGLQDGVYYHPPKIVRQPVMKEEREIPRFAPTDKLSLLRNLF